MSIKPEITDITEEEKSIKDPIILNENYILVDNNIDETIVGCPYQCDWTGPFNELQKHKSTCKKCKVKCTLCNNMYLSEFLVQHTVSECTERKVPCDCCHMYMSAKELESHKNVCGERIVKCKHPYCPFKAPANLMEEHEQEDVAYHVSVYIKEIKTLKKENKDLLKINNDWAEHCDKLESQRTSTIIDTMETMDKYYKEKDRLERLKDPFYYNCRDYFNRK